MVYDEAGVRVDGDDDASDPDDPSVVVASLQEGLPASSYTVQWTVTSADGDPVSGEYSFGVNASAGTVEQTSEPVGGELTGTRGSGLVPVYAGLALCCVAVLLGLALRARGR